MYLTPPRHAVAVIMLVLVAPLGSSAEPPGPFPSWTAPTLADVLSREPFAPLGIGSGMSATSRSTPSVTRESLEGQLRMRMQSRLQNLPLDLTPGLSSDAANRLTPVPRPGDIIDLPRQRSSWLALVAGDYRTAAAHLHDALLRGRTATLAELHALAGSEQAYELHLEKLLAESELGKSERFLLAYHAALRGDLPLARQSLTQLEQQLPEVKLDPIVRLRLRQLLQ